MRFRASWAVILASALLVGLLAYGVASRGQDTSIDDAIAEGKRIDAPTERLPVLGKGGERSLADYKGKVVVLNFWASWCKPCTEELPLLEKTHKAISGPRRAGARRQLPGRVRQRAGLRAPLQADLPEPA